MHFKIKTINGNKYLYLIKNARVDGKVKQVKQICVGSPEKVHQMMLGTQPISIRSFSFGKAAALLHAAQHLDLINVINDNVEKKNVSGLTVGEYTLLLIVGRSERVKSRRGIKKWFKKESALQFLFNPVYQLSSQNCLNQMKRLDEAAIDRIEESLTKNIVEKGIKPTTLIFDTTNRFSYVDEGEELFQHGNSKQKRFSKKIVGLALAVNDDNVPFLSDVYPGNEHDSKVFQRVFDKICKRIENLDIKGVELSIIFDKGINSEDNINKVLDKMHIIGSLSRSEAGDLLEVPLKQFEPIYTNDKGHQISAWRTRGVRFGDELELVVAYNPATKKRQKNTYEKRKKKILDSIDDLKKRCFREGKGRKPTEKGIINAITDCIPKDLRGVFDYAVKYRNDGRPYPHLEICKDKERELYSSFGKTILFTDNENYTTEQIIRGYNSKYLIEEDFKWLNDRVIMPLWPFFVRKDISVRAHVFLCLLGLMLYRYLLWELDIDGLTIPKLASHLEGMRLAILMEGRRNPRFVVENMDKKQATIFSKLNLGRFVP